MTVKRKAALAAAGLGAAAASVALGPTSTAGAAAGDTVTQDISCTAQKNISGFFGWDFFTTGTVSVNFNATLRFRVNGDNSRANFQSISYRFTNAKYDYWIDTPGGGPLTQNLSVNNHSNVDFTTVGWNSADNLAASGTLTAGVNGPSFSVANGANTSVRGIPDIADMPDPSCTTSATLSWK